MRISMSVFSRHTHTHKETASLMFQFEFKKGGGLISILKGKCKNLVSYSTTLPTVCQSINHWRTLWFCVANGVFCYENEQSRMLKWAFSHSEPGLGGNKKDQKQFLWFCFEKNIIWSSLMSPWNRKWRQLKYLFVSQFYKVTWKMMELLEFHWLPLVVLLITIYAHLTQFR